MIGWILRHPHHFESLLGCGNLVPAPPHTTSGETLTCTSRSLSKGPVVRGFCWLTSLLNLGQNPSTHQMVPFPGPGEF